MNTPAVTLTVLLIAVAVGVDQTLGAVGVGPKWRTAIGFAMCAAVAVCYAAVVIAGDDR